MWKLNVQNFKLRKKNMSEILTLNEKTNHQKTVIVSDMSSSIQTASQNQNKATYVERHRTFHSKWWK